MIEQTTETRSWFFEMSNDTDKLLARLIKNKTKQKQKLKG